jgi:acetyl esterase/lipase
MVNKLFLFMFVFFVLSKVYAQSISGLTLIPDTSYNTNSAFLSTKKTHPFIKKVEEIHLSSFCEKKNIVYHTIKANSVYRELILDAFYPSKKNKSNNAAVIIIHGGGWRSGNRMQHYPLAQHLANLGYVCFTPEYRLSTEALFPAAVFDIKSALNWVRENATFYNVDTSKIAVLGFSAGGELAAFMGTTNGNNKFEDRATNSKFSSDANAVVDIDGILSFVHPESGEGDDSKRISAATYWFGWPKKDNVFLWTDGSPLSHAGIHTPPTLFINSSIIRMHAGREDYINILKNLSIYSQVVSFEDAPHSFCLFEPWFEPTVKYIDAFLKKVFIN